MAQVTVQYSECNEPQGEFTVTLVGHDMDSHLAQIVEQWRTMMTLKQREWGDLAEDEEIETFNVETVIPFQNMVCFTASPYRGEDIHFLFTPPTT